MKSILELNDKKIPVVRIDKSLNKYSNVVLFPEKVALAKKMLETTNFREVIGKK